MAKKKKTSVGGPTDPLERTSQCKSQDDPHCSVLVLFTPHSSHAFSWRCCASLGMPFFLPGIYPVGFIGFRDTNTQTQKKKSLGAKGWFASSVFFCGRKARTGKQGNTETTETSTQKMSIKFFLGLSPRSRLLAATAACANTLGTLVPVLGPPVRPLSDCAVMRCLRRAYLHSTCQ